MAKQICLPRRIIKEKLHFLHSKLPKPPTPTDEIFQVPKNLILKIQTSNYSQDSIQELANLIGFYLGLLQPVKVKIGAESSPHMLMGGTDWDRLDRVGLYKVYGYDHSEIEITKKFRYKIHHVLAILVHESIHNYLYRYGVKHDNEKENEILTDVASAYLGLGHIVYRGYKPITWIDNEKYTFERYSYTKHNATIGYLKSGTIFNATMESVKLRGFDVEKVLNKFGFIDRIWMYLSLLKYISQKKRRTRDELYGKRILEKNKKSILAISNRIKSIYDKYKNVEATLKKISVNTSTSIGEKEIAFKIVEIMNKLSTGEVENEIKFVIKKIENIGLSDSEDMNINELQENIDRVNKIVEEWDEISLNIK